ncbi:MAG: hypothetical protein ACYC3S_14015 [Chloroflexota bacterium]
MLKMAIIGFLGIVALSVTIASFTAGSGARSGSTALVQASGFGDNRVTGQLLGQPGPVPPAATAAGMPVVTTSTSQSVTLRGSGRQTTGQTELPSPLSVLRIAHTGSSNFVVRARVGNDNELLVNAIGSYSGSRPLLAREPVAFDVRADGAWSISIEPMANGGAPTFSGSGDAVSSLFAPPPSGIWDFQHDGATNFILWLKCGDGVSLVQNMAGPARSNKVVAFGQGACYWEVEADGNWSLTPR